jgi:4-oxalocrotonate tautomerase
MPSVHVKLVKQQVNSTTRQMLIDGVMDIITGIMGRDKNFTVITLDEIDAANWYIGSRPVSENPGKYGGLFYLEIKISKGTSYAAQMLEVIKAGRELIKRVLGSCDPTNYFVIHELNPDSWGFDGLSMTERNRLEA